MKCCDVHAGKLRHRIKLQRQEYVSDGGGGQEVTWFTYAHPLAWIRPLSGNEGLMGLQVQDSVTHDIIIRYRSGVKAAHRVVYDGREFNVKAALNLEERDRWIELRCEEGVAT